MIGPVTVADYIVVGSGITGATIARTLADAGREVVVIERRPFVGGNVRDALHGCGIPYHLYGPHYFWTKSQRLWDFVNRFSRFYPFQAEVKCVIDHQYELWPLRAETIARLEGRPWAPAPAQTVSKPTDFESAALRLMPRSAFDRFIDGYTRKQWGVAPSELEAKLAQRLSVREDDSPLLRLHPFQGLPAGGFSAWMESMLTGIECHVGVDYLTNRDRLRARCKLIYTGAIDEFFGYDGGRLRYRAQRRQHVYLPGTIGSVMPCVQVNHPGLDVDYIRTIEWKHLLEAGQDSVNGTLLTIETPYSPELSDHYEYPFPGPQDQSLYRRYRNRADAIDGLMICGRLGEYKYYDIDQAIARALTLGKRILS